MARRIGLYLGVNSMGGVTVEGKKITSLTKFDFSSLEDEVKVESLNEEVKWEALINRTLRDMGVTDKNVFLSLADKDFIVRSLEMPLMSKKEVETALMYEIEKYIPFKLGELRWDYAFSRSVKEKKINISFVGAIQKNLQKFQNVLAHLGLTPMAIEPSSLSLVRVVKSNPKVSKLKNFAILDFTEQEAYLTFYYYDLPIFNRYLAVGKKEGGTEQEKFIESVRLSFQYFKREFRQYEVDTLVMVSNFSDENLGQMLKDELHVEIISLTPSQLCGRGDGEIENIKALGVAGREHFPYLFRPTLRSGEGAIEIGERIEGAPLRVGLLAILVGVCLAVTIGISVFLEEKIGMQRSKYRRLARKIYVPKVLEGLSLEEMEAKVEEREEEVKTFEAVVSPVKKFAPFLENFSTSLTEGMWLDNLRLSTLRDEGYKGSIRGFVFLGDSYKERLNIDRFISNLRKNEVVRNVFSSIELDSTQRKRVKGYELTSFQIELKEQ